MSTASLLVRLLAVSAFAAGSPTVSVDSTSPTISTGDAVAVAPAQSLENTGGNVVLGTPSESPPAALAAPQPAPVVRVAPVRPVTPNANVSNDAAIRARQLADEAVRHAWQQVADARQQAADAQARAAQMANAAHAQARAQAEAAVAAATARHG